MPKRKTKFADIWLKNADFVGWLSRKSESLAYCSYCCKEFDISNMGEASLKSHLKSKKHSERAPCKSGKEFFKPIGTKEVSKPKEGSTSTVNQSSICSFIERDAVITAEIRWTLKVVQSNYSQRSCEDIAELFKIMFPGHQFTDKFTLGRTKCGYYINHGLAPHFLQKLITEVKESPKYALSFDESLNKMLQKGQMDILVRYWYCEKGIAISRYLNSEFMGGANAEQILATFLKATKSLDTRNLLQISSDGPNVNLKFLELHKNKRDLDELPTLADIGTCGLHTIHGSLKNGIKSNTWNIGKVLKSMAKLLDESPARREKYEMITESNIYPLPYCGHRWCENENCAKRAEQIWPGFVKFIGYLNKLPKSQQPKGKSFQVLQEAVKDPLIPAKLKLVEFLASKLNKFLTGFQTDQPMVPFLHDVLKERLTSMMKMFIISDVMVKADTTQKLLKLDPLDKNLHKPYSIDVSTGAQLHIAKYKKSEGWKASTVKQFYDGAIVLLSNVVKHMMEKCPLKYQLVRCSSCMNPNKLAMQSMHDVSQVKFSKMVEKLTSLNQITAKIADDSKEQFSTFLDEVVPKHREKFHSFSMFDQRLDTFLTEFVVDKEFASLKSVFIIVFCLSHGQSAIERGFKTNKEFSVVNQSEDSLKSLRIVHDHMLAKDVKAHNINVTRDMIKSVASARSRYMESLESARSQKKSTEKDLKRKIINNEMKEVRKKKIRIQESINELTKDADMLALRAEETNNFKDLGRSNDLRKTANLKKEELEECTKMEQSLLLRKDSII